MNDIRELFESDGNSYEAIRLIKPSTLLVWDKSGKVKSGAWTGMTGWNEEVCREMSIEEIELDVLKSMKLYNSGLLSIEIKDRMEHLVRNKDGQVKELMAKARAGRKAKYTNIPKELTCSICKGTVEAIPSKIAKIVEKKGILLVDYLAGFKCKKCADPVRRGRAVNPLYANLPKIMKCACGNEVTANFVQLSAKAERLGTTIEELIKNYKCQTCEKTPRGKRK